jgi:ADP-ribose pyrophosphatase YjhB (NUDIX family)
MRTPRHPLAALNAPLQWAAAAVLLHRGNRDHACHVLMVTRPTAPFAGLPELPFALLGGRDPVDAASLALAEQTGLTVHPAELRFAGIFDVPARGAHGEVITAAYGAVLAAPVPPRTDTACWRPIDDLHQQTWRNQGPAFDDLLIVGHVMRHRFDHWMCEGDRRFATVRDTR